MLHNLPQGDGRRHSGADVVLVPGLSNSGPGHWQTLWQAQRGDCRRAHLGDWDRPTRDRWVQRLDSAIRQNGAIRQNNGPVVLVAHSLGCHAVAWWANTTPDAAKLVRAALFVAPAEVDFFPIDERLEDFSPTPAVPLPFASLLVASQNDPYMNIHSARQLARRWGADFLDAGLLGHINAQSGLGDWAQGQDLLETLVAQNEPPQAKHLLDVTQPAVDNTANHSQRSIHP
jgi:predicted alpha/beta hydrolase family esterase